MPKTPNKKPPLTIAERPWEPKTIDDLPILPDILQWGREGITLTEIARRIHRQGFFPQWKEITVIKKVEERLKKLPPGELASQKISLTVIRAANEVGSGAERIAALVKQYTEHEEDIKKQREDLEGRRIDLQRQRQFVQRLYDMIERLSQEDYESEAPLPAGMEKGNSGVDLLLEIKSALAIGDETFSVPAEVAAMSRKDALLYLLANSSIMDRFRGHIDAMSKLSDSLSKAKAQLNKAEQEARENIQAQVVIIDKLGLLDPTDAGDTAPAVEARQQEYIKKAFKGKKAVIDTLSNPESRNRVMALLEKALSRPRLQDAIEAHVVPEEPKKKVIKKKTKKTKGKKK